MEQVILKKVLDEILAEMKLANEEKEKNNSALENLSGRIEQFDEKLMTVKLQVPDINTSGIEHLFREHLQKANLHLQTHFSRVEKLEQAKTVKEKMFYWFPWLLVMILCAIIFKIAIRGNSYGSVF